MHNPPALESNIRTGYCVPTHCIGQNHRGKHLKIHAGMAEGWLIISTCFWRANRVVSWVGRAVPCAPADRRLPAYLRMKRTLVVVPTYNERENLPPLVQRLLAL